MDPGPWLPHCVPSSHGGCVHRALSLLSSCFQYAVYNVFDLVRVKPNVAELSRGQLAQFTDCRLTIPLIFHSLNELAEKLHCCLHRDWGSMNVVRGRALYFWFSWPIIGPNERRFRET